MDILQQHLPEVTVLRSVLFTAKAGQKLFFLPIGEHFLDAPSETELYVDNVLHRPGDGFYSHVKRGTAGWMNTTDAMIGIALTTPTAGGEQVVLYWHQRLILLQPASVALVHCTQDGGGIWRPDYSTDMRWRQNDPLVAPNAIQVANPPPDYVVEWWRLTRVKGGNHGGNGAGYRAGRRYMPVFRGPAVVTDNDSLFLRTQFDGSSTACPWRHFRVCYYNPTTGARGNLSSEVIISAGPDHPDQHNSHGPCRYNLWVNR
jgi:hypothetical protein